MQRSFATLRVRIGVITFDSYCLKLQEARQAGSPQLTHHLYSIWLQQQRPDPSTDYLDSFHLRNAVFYAVAQPTCLAYLCPHGFEDRQVIGMVVMAAYKSKDTSDLQVLLGHGWNINMPEAYCEPAFMGYIKLSNDNIKPTLIYHIGASSRWDLWRAGS